MKTTRSISYLKELLKEQINFLKSSCVSFDDGFSGEAKRIATVIRVLVHDTKNSHSLLNLLNLKNIEFYNSSYKLEPSNSCTHIGLVFMRIELVNNGSEYLPFLDDVLPDSNRLDKFENWWSEIVIKDKNHNSFSREDIILLVSNKEGGAHVDPKLDIKFENLLRNNSINWHFNSGGKVKPFGKESNQLVMASIRQIGHELLKTLEPYSI